MLFKGAAQAAEGADIEITQAAGARMLLRALSQAAGGGRCALHCTTRMPTLIIQGVHIKLRYMQHIHATRRCAHIMLQFPYTVQARTEGRCVLSCPAASPAPEPAAASPLQASQPCVKALLLQEPERRPVLTRILFSKPAAGGRSSSSKVGTMRPPAGWGGRGRSTTCASTSSPPLCPPTQPRSPQAHLHVDLVVGLQPLVKLLPGQPLLARHALQHLHDAGHHALEPCGGACSRSSTVLGNAHCRAAAMPSRTTQLQTLRNSPQK